MYSITLKGLRELVSNFSGGRGAFYTMHRPRIDHALSLWKRELPTVTPYYAVKCNPEPQFLKTLFDRGIRFDCASERELKEVACLGPSMESRIVYANPCKSGRDLVAAKAMGSPLTVVDSVEEIAKLGGYRGGTLVRIAVDDSGSAMPFSSKFGCAREEVTRIGEAAAAAGVDVHGVSFHVGSGCTEGVAYERAIEAAYRCVELLRGVRGSNRGESIVDIGGGFLPVMSDFEQKAASIRAAMRGIGDSSIRWIAEPGRFLAANSFQFFVQVIGKKAGSKDTWHYTIDDSLYGQFTCILFDQARPHWVRIPMSDEAPRRLTSGTVFGRTCDSVDVIARASVMEELEVGDWLWFPNMGAYTRATASEFNGFPSPPVFAVDDALEGAERAMQMPSGIRRVPPISAASVW